MTNILILNQNLNLVTPILPHVEWHKETTNTSTTTVTQEQFTHLYLELKQRRLNPFALLYWEPAN